MNICLHDARSLYHYDPDTGDFTYKQHRGPNAKIGDVAGSVNSEGYRQITVYGKRIVASRLAYMMYYDKILPSNVFVDHINGNKGDNRISNLREASNSENQKNVGVRKHNKLGLRGVSYDHSCGKYIARYKSKVLGVFDDPKKASDAYEDEVRMRYGDFYRNPYK